jgi:hypothetical protein
MRLILPQMAKWKLRQDLSEAIPQTNRTRSNLSTSTTLCPSGLSSCSLVGQVRAHMTCGCTRSFMTWTSPISLLLGGRPQVRYTWWFRGLATWPQGTTEHKPFKANSTQVIHSICCFLSFPKHGFQHLAKTCEFPLNATSVRQRPIAVAILLRDSKTSQGDLSIKI